MEYNDFSMKICALQKTTLIDYPGRVAATVFTAGCNFRCPWCYSKELVLPELIAAQPVIPEAEILEFLKGKQGLLEGVVLCGGEPTLHPDLPGFIKKIKDLGFAVKLDSNGSNPRMLKDLIKKKLIDYVAMDIKLPKGRYPMVFGATLSVDDIEESIKILKNSDIGFEFRTTVAPGVHTVDDLEKMARWIGEEVPGRKPKYFLQNFRPGRNIDPSFEARRPFPPEFFKEAEKKVKPFVSEFGIR
jgi:pyruvate formate lyase activating enzyme